MGVNRKYNFVNLISGAHIQNVELVYGNRPQSGVKKPSLTYRSMYRVGAFLSRQKSMYNQTNFFLNDHRFISLI